VHHFDPRARAQTIVDEIEIVPALGDDVSPSLVGVAPLERTERCRNLTQQIVKEVVIVRVVVD
jgi:hypothetical protein